MAKKTAKKSKASANSKSKKVGKVKKSTLGSALKKAAKLASRLGAAKKPIHAKKSEKSSAGKRGGSAAENLSKKKTASSAAAKGKRAQTEQAVKVKKVKTPVPAPAPVKTKAKGKKELLVEVPAPKGIAILGREGKKKGKPSAAELQAIAAKKRCREPGCDHDFSLSGYCRLHYIKNWRKIKRKESIIASGQLNNYVEELVHKYPDKYLEVIRQDLASEKDWAKVVVDLELESSEEDANTEEEMDAVPEGVRRDRGEFEDEGESF